MRRRRRGWTRFIFNKDIIATIIFLVIIFFIKKDNIFKINKLNNILESMEAEIKEYDRVYTQDSITLEKLKHDSAFREKYAREHYYLKNENEDVFIIEKEDK
ncbi:MAG: hypothetical protein ACOX4D_08795 [Bacteroidales bacterium]|jgi:cell division protein DivIC